METFIRSLPSLALVMCCSLLVHAQRPLDRYIEEGLGNNLVLQQRRISLTQAQMALKIARNQFLPAVQLLADYTSGDGGREISIPVGDLLNPVYQSLNQLTESSQFPQIANVSENFFPRNFYDARVRASLPIINSDLVVNRSIKGKQMALAEHEVKIYERQLLFDITDAYYRHLAALQAVKIQENALEIVARNVEISESLKRNGKGLPAQVLRAKSELEKIRSELQQSIVQVSNTRRYLNFLVNRDLESSVENSFEMVSQPFADTTLTVANREELQMQVMVREINSAIVRMNQLRRLPRVNAFVDVGSQASDWRYDDRSRYYLFGVQVAIPIFQGFANQLNIEQSRLDVRKSELALANTRAALMLSAEIAKDNLYTAHQNLVAAQKQLEAAESYFKLIDKGYAEGVNTQIEFLDARNQLTGAQLLSNVRTFDTLIAHAKFQRETASSSIQH